MSIDTNVQDMRQHYMSRSLQKKDVDKNPFKQFRLWFEEVTPEEFVEPNAMNIATVNEKGEISSRVVLLKSFDEQGFVFFTNYESKKANDLASTKRAALTFWWDRLHRQIRIRGLVEKISREETVKYFRTRPRGSQIGAIASKQSRVIESHKYLENEYIRLEQQFQNQEIPCPDGWGGYRVVPMEFEFWQGRPNRLHDRLRYTKKTTDWVIERLSP